jgi:hypothetical protein
VDGQVVKPSIVVLADQVPANYETLMLTVVPINPTTRQPILGIKVDGSTVGIDWELTSDLYPLYSMPTFRFKKLCLKTGASNPFLGHDIQLAFSLWSTHAFPPVQLAEAIFPSRIRLVDSFQRLPAPLITKIIPNIVPSNKKVDVFVFGQHFVKGKGTLCGISFLGNPPSLTPSSLEETFPLITTATGELVSSTFSLFYFSHKKQERETERMKTSSLLLFFSSVECSSPNQKLFQSAR